MQIETTVKPSQLSAAITRVFSLAQQKIPALDRSWDFSRGAPVFTVDGKYTSRGWTEWTQGFQFGCGLLTFDATDDRALLDSSRQRILDHMTPHITHTGVHDHGFNNISTYGNLRRLLLENRLPHNEWELNFYNLALKCSGAVQAARWTSIESDDADAGFIHSFNGPHSLFIDTMRTVRILAISHQLGHSLTSENDRKINLLHRLIAHAITSARYNIYYGENRDAYDIPNQRGRTAHEAIFNITSGQYRCPNSQQGYSPFTTWTRGLAWAMLGFAEQLEFLATVSDNEFPNLKSEILKMFEAAGRAACDFYLTRASTTDGICYWDNGAPNLVKIGNWQARPADPFNDHEPVDSSASAIAAQGLLRLGKYLNESSYTQAGLMIARTLFAEPYLATDPRHQGLLLHSVYHRPNGWDHVPAGRKVPCNESSMWGDYHLLELALYLHRLNKNAAYLKFFD